LNYYSEIIPIDYLDVEKFMDKVGLHTIELNRPTKIE
jgi:hypothetical protein